MMPLDALISLVVLGLSCWFVSFGCFCFKMRVLGWLLGHVRPEYLHRRSDGVLVCDAFASLRIPRVISGRTSAKLLP